MHLESYIERLDQNNFGKLKLMFLSSCVIAGTFKEMPPVHGPDRICQGPAGGGGQQERQHPAGGDRRGEEPRGEQEAGRRQEEGETQEEEEGEQKEGF